MTANVAPPLPADLAAGLKRLKLAAMRRLAPQLLVTAKTQRWNPEELLRTLVQAEISARDESNARTRMRSATFPVAKTLDQFHVPASSVPPATFDYLASLEWIRAAENVCLIGPAGTGKSHLLTASAWPPSPPATGSATSPPPSSSRPSTAAWPKFGRPGHRHPAAQRRVCKRFGDLISVCCDATPPFGDPVKPARCSGNLAIRDRGSRI